MALLPTRPQMVCTRRDPPPPCAQIAVVGRLGKGDAPQRIPLSTIELRSLQMMKVAADESSMRAGLRIVGPIVAFLGVLYVPPVRDVYDAGVASLSKAFGHSVQDVVDDLPTTTTTP